MPETPFTIEQGVPLPARKYGRTGGWCRTLAVSPKGSSVFVPMPPRVASGCCGKHGAGWYATRPATQDGVAGARVWKVSEPPKFRNQKGKNKRG